MSAWLKKEIKATEEKLKSLKELESLLKSATHSKDFCRFCEQVTKSTKIGHSCVCGRCGHNKKESPSVDNIYPSGTTSQP